MGHLIFESGTDIKGELEALKKISPAARAIFKLRGQGANPDELLGETIVYYERIKKHQDEQLFKYIQRYGVL